MTQNIFQARRQPTPRQPQAITLRYLQTLTDIAGDKSSTIVFPLPVDLLRSLAANAKASEKGEGTRRIAKAGRALCGEPDSLV